MMIMCFSPRVVDYFHKSMTNFWILDLKPTLQLAKPFNIFSKSTIWMLLAKLVTHRTTKFFKKQSIIDESWGGKQWVNTSFYNKNDHIFDVLGQILPRTTTKISAFTNKMLIFRYERLVFFCRNITEDGRGFFWETEDFSVWLIGEESSEAATKEKWPSMLLLSGWMWIYSGCQSFS